MCAVNQSMPAGYMQASDVLYNYYSVIMISGALFIQSLFTRRSSVYVSLMLSLSELCVMLWPQSSNASLDGSDPSCCISSRVISLLPWRNPMIWELIGKVMRISSTLQGGSVIRRDSVVEERRGEFFSFNTPSFSWLLKAVEWKSWWYLGENGGNYGIGNNWVN